MQNSVWTIITVTSHKDKEDHSNIEATEKVMLVK